MGAAYRQHGAGYMVVEQVFAWRHVPCGVTPSLASRTCSQMTFDEGCRTPAEEQSRDYEDDDSRDN